MAHFKKLRLVPADSDLASGPPAFEAIKQEKAALSPAYGLIASAASADRQMSEILARDDLSPDIKLRLFAIAGNYLRSLRDQALKREEAPGSAPHQEEKLEPRVKENPRINQQEILASIPANQRTKATRLLDALAHNPEFIGTDGLGQLTIDSRPIEGSNLSTLVRSLYLKASRQNFPTGMDEFVSALRSLDLPTSLIENRSIRTLLGAKSEPEKLAESQEGFGRKRRHTSKHKTKKVHKRTSKVIHSNLKSSNKPKAIKLLRLYRV